MLTDKEKQEQFLAIFLPLQMRLERFVLVKVRSETEAKDIVGETILAAYERFESVIHPEAFLSFLFTIASRICNQRRDRNWRFEGLEEYHIENILDPTASPEVRADISILQKAIDSLPEREREELILFEIVGMSLKETAELRGGTVVALKVRMMRARKKIKAMLEDDLQKKNPLFRRKTEFILLPISKEYYIMKNIDDLFLSVKNNTRRDVLLPKKTRYSMILAQAPRSSAIVAASKKIYRVGYIMRPLNFNCQMNLFSC